MQIVRNLAGYSFGRSDLVRRAMSKKKADVMEKERANFIYGNEEEGVKGCIANGIPEEVAGKIFQDMTDFAKYAFNKSHAAAYAVVAYQTAWLKCYYPVEFMAALLTSVRDNTRKITEYIANCRQMGIAILPPDINEGENSFSVSGNTIRYGMSAVKGIGGSIVDNIIAERKRGGKYASLTDFVERLSGKEVNKRTIENLIKAGAFDSIEGNRKQKMSVYAQIIDQVNRERKNVMSGQLSLFDMGDDELKQSAQIRMPKVEEYEKEVLLAMEKEVLGIYISGHPLENYEALMKKNVTHHSVDFVADGEDSYEESEEMQQMLRQAEETDRDGVMLQEAGGERGSKVTDGEMVVIGGMITGKTVKTTRSNTLMAFLEIEDMMGTVEVLVFPADYERYKNMLENDRKVLVMGKASLEEGKAGKVICQKIIPFEQVPRELWIQFTNRKNFEEHEQELYGLIADYDGGDSVKIYLREEKMIKQLPPCYNVNAIRIMEEEALKVYGEDSVKIVEKSIANSHKNPRKEY